MSSTRTSKAIVTRTAEELAEALGLSPLDAAEIEMKSAINSEIIRIVNRTGLTHEAVAKGAKTSRSRVTAILNRDTHEVSTDLMLRILSSLGYRAHVTFKKVRGAA